MSATTIPTTTLATIVSALSGRLKRATAFILVNDEAATALTDTGSSGSFISDNHVKRLKSKVNSATGNVSMSSSSLNSPIKELYMVKINLLGESYPNIKLSVLADVCYDVILGQDLMSQHSEVSFAFGGTRKRLRISNSSRSVPSASVDMPFLFSDLTTDCKPIATKSRWFGSDDNMFVLSEIEMMPQKGVIEESISSWRAQVLIVTNELKRKRLKVDYSQTINRFTWFDGYSLSRINDVVYKIFRFRYYSSFDLKSTFHQIPIRN